MAHDRSLWDAWRRGLTDGTTLQSLVRKTSSDVLVALLEDADGGDSATRAAIAHALAVRLQRARDDAETHDVTVRDLSKRNQDATRAARADVVHARSTHVESERILENRQREKNVGARLRFNIRNANGHLDAAEKRLEESERLDDAIATTSRAYAERARGDSEEKERTPTRRVADDTEAAG